MTLGCGAVDRAFLVLGGEDGWGRGLGEGVSVSAAGLELASHEETAVDVALDAGELPADLAAVDVALGRCRLLYFLESAPPALRLYDPGQDRTETISCVGGLFRRPGALAFTPATLYVADPAAADRIVAVAAINHQIRWTAGAERDAAGRPLGLEAPLLPLDLAVGGGDVYALTPLETAGEPPSSVPAGTRLAIVRFDAGGRALAVLRPESLVLGADRNLEAPAAALALAVAADGAIYVLEGGGRRLFKLSPEGEPLAGFPVDLSAVESVPPAIEPFGLALDADGRVYVGDGRPAPAAEQEDDRFLHRFSPAGEYLGPLSGYRGRTRALEVDAGGRVYVLDDEGRRLVILSRRRGFAGGEAGKATGAFFSPLYDSARAAVTWHRLVAAAEIPAGTQVRISQLTLEDPRAYEEALAGGDLAALAALPWSPRLVDPRDALIRAAPGRYLGVRLELESSGAETPRIRRLIAHFPRSSYLRFLPAVFREGLGEDAFFERFLALFETLLGGVEDEIERLVRHFDAEAADDAFLAWLASWLAIATEEGWPEDRLRAIVLRAPELFRQRGTRQGLAALVEILTGGEPILVEHFQLRCTRDPELSALLDRLYGGDPYAFCVLLRPGQTADDEELLRVRRLIDAEKPAHTRAGVVQLQPWIFLDAHTYLEINTRLSEPVPRLDAGAAIARDSVLTEPPEAGQVERRARVELDTELT